MDNKNFDVAVVGGGPAGASAALELAERGYDVALLEREHRIKPCGGAVPPILLREFDVPESLLETRVTSARMISPANQQVDMDIGGFVGMVSRAHFDPWLRQRAALAGATPVTGMAESAQTEADGQVRIDFRRNGRDGPADSLRARIVIGADGANSRMRQQLFRRDERMRHVFAYHEIVAAPSRSEQYDPKRCDVYYQGQVSPDFYGWVFPHGDSTSVGAGTAIRGFSLRGAVQQMRERSGLAGATVIRREGAPLPLKPLRRWDNGRNALVVGDAAGAVAPSSGEGIYYAMTSGRLAASAVARTLETGKPRYLRQARRDFMRQHRLVFFILGIMQHYWYGNDSRREKFVDICRDPDVQRLTWDAYMNKRLKRAKPAAHVRIFFKDLAHLVGLHPS